MNLVELIEFAITQRGQGWLGAMNIIDALESEDTLIPREQAIEIKRRMQIRFGEQILGDNLGRDEYATEYACNQCIEDVAAYNSTNNELQCGLAQG